MKADAWFQQKALEAERGRNGGKLVWHCIRDIQKARRGLVPVRTATVKDEDSNTCTKMEAKQERWRRHFTKILNIQSEFDMMESRRVRQRPPRPEITKVPSEDELLSAVRKVRNGKVVGSQAFWPEMIKATCCDKECPSKLLELVEDIQKGNLSN